MVTKKSTNRSAIRSEQITIGHAGIKKLSDIEDGNQAINQQISNSSRRDQIGV
jgi:hypothetical protein